MVNPERLQIIVADSRDGSEGMQLWSGVPQQTLFDSYVVESLNGNQIAFQVMVENLERALKSAQYSTECLCKLSKKHGITFLSFIIEIHGSQVMTVMHDVPVRVLTATDVGMLTEPTLQDPTVHIMLPPLKQLKPIIDRLKKLDETLMVECNMDGTLKLGVQTDAARITTIVTGLEHPKVEGQDAPIRDANLWGSVRVDMKKMSRFMGADSMNPSAVVCCIIVNKAVVMHVILEQIYLTYYIPVKLL